MAASPCQRCGACCVTYRISLPRIELASRGGPVPDALTEPYTPTTACLRINRHDSDHPDRCIALEGTVGVFVSCSIYPQRPSACGDFAPLTALGYGDDACNAARHRCGLPPLLCL